MTSGHQGKMLADLGTLFSEGCAAGLSEGQLLDRFLSNGDEAAFEAILRRHGPMVLGVCRRRLSDPGDVDDAFQATFLILVERGRTLRDRDILGTWLHRVAHRVATRARSDAYRRREFEGRGVLSRRHEREASPEAAAERADLRAILDEELARLTEKYRTPLILCELEGRTHEQAAAQMRCPVGTVKSRLSRARAQLRSRLERRGVSATSGLVPAAFSFESVPAVLSDSTLRAAARFVAGNEVVAPAVAALMKSASRSTLMTLSKLCATVLSTAVIISAAAGGQEPPAKPAVSAAPERQKPRAAPDVDSKPAIPPASSAVAVKEVTIAGRCLDQAEKTPMPGATVRLFAARGYTAPIVEVAKTKTDGEGRFSFAAVPRQRLEDLVDPLSYTLVAEVKGKPIGVGAVLDGLPGSRQGSDILIFGAKTKVSGMLFDAQGQPVAGATVSQLMFDGRPVPGILMDVTDPDGRFSIDGVALNTDSPPNLRFDVAHPDYPIQSFRVSDALEGFGWKLADGCIVKGTVTDSVTGGPAAGVVVTAESVVGFERIFATTDAQGRYSMILMEDTYNFSAVAKERVSVAITNKDCLGKEVKDMPPLSLIEGGFIAGRVVNAKSGKPITVGNGGEPIELGFHGPSYPARKPTLPRRTAVADSNGHYSMRAAPGDNFPYLINLAGDRMAWNTKNQAAIVVKAGETTAYDMLVTREATSAEKMKDAREFIAALPADPAKRTARILEEFRKLSLAVDKTELWCSLMRDLVGMGRDAVPLICAELDRTTEDAALRRLAFALRAIGDKSAVPALIRAIPRTLLLSSGHVLFFVAEETVEGADELAAFMQEHVLKDGIRRGRSFSFETPVKEVFGSLRELTGMNFDEVELFDVFLSQDPRCQVFQGRLFAKQAKKWANWWDEHGRELVGAKFESVNLKISDKPLPPSAKEPFGPGARISQEDCRNGLTLCPPRQTGDERVPYFYDLDTGAKPKWPAHIPKDEAHLDIELLAKWAAENGVDLMCVTHKAADGTPTFVLRQFGLKAYEDAGRDNFNLDLLLNAGKLELGHKVGDLLVHFDEATKQEVPGANAGFFYITREGTQGTIEITDRWTKAPDLTNRASPPPPGVGELKGVRFILMPIIASKKP